MFCSVVSRIHQLRQLQVKGNVFVVSENHPVSTSFFPLIEAPEAVSEPDNIAHFCTEFVSFLPDQVYPCNWLSVKPNYKFLITENPFRLTTTTSLNLQQIVK